MVGAEKQSLINPFTPTPMSQKPNNPPAFPRPVSRDDRYAEEDAIACAQDGMRLRDYFAIRATEEDICRCQHLGDTREFARYRFADAMLAERSKGEEI